MLREASAGGRGARAAGHVFTRVARARYQCPGRGQFATNVRRGGGTRGQWPQSAAFRSGISPTLPQFTGGEDRRRRDTAGGSFASRAADIGRGGCTVQRRGFDAVSATLARPVPGLAEFLATQTASGDRAAADGSPGPTAGA